MTHFPTSTETPPDAAAGSTPEPLELAAPASSTPAPSYVKLAMRNMVRKGGKSFFHFSLTSLGLLGTLVGLAYLTR